MNVALHVATRSDWRSRLVRKRLVPKRNVGERRSDRLDSSSGLSGGRTTGEQRRRHFGELRFYTQGLLPRDLLQHFVSTIGGAALAFRFANSGTLAGDRSPIQSAHKATLEFRDVQCGLGGNRHARAMDC